MQIAYATTFAARDVHNWSGSPFYMSKAFENAQANVEYIESLARRLPFGFKAKQVYKKWICGQRESPRFNVVAAQFYSQQVQERLRSSKADVVVAPQINPVAYLDCKQPIILWTDAVYASLVAYNPAFHEHSAESIRQGNIITKECLSRAGLAIFTSEWAAQSAISLYGVNKEKVRVVPFGANIELSHTEADVREFIKHRSQSTIKLLFLGKRWEQKGGDKVLAVAKALHESGNAVELDIVGCHPPKELVIPPYVKCWGFISKRTVEGQEQIKKLLREAHFLFIMPHGEAFGVVFCEANAYGVPCLASYVGGIPTIIRDGVNGMTFSMDAQPEVFCNYIVGLMSDRKKYEEMAWGAFNEYQTRLNWGAAVKNVRGQILAL